MWTFLNELINLYNRDVQQKDRNHNNGQAEERKERKEKRTGYVTTLLQYTTPHYSV